MYVNALDVAYYIIIVRFFNSQNVNELLLATSPLGRGYFGKGPGFEFYDLIKL